MDKYEYRIRAEEINALIEKKQFVEAVRIADTIDWSRVKSVMMLCKVSELYKYVRRFDDAKEILLLAYDRQPGGRKIVYSLCELAIKLEETVQAVEYYKEFVQVAPTDTRRFILQYRLYEAQDVSLEERIAVLEEYKKRDYREKWAYELAYLYHRIGLATRCVEECDELILWFGEGKYVTMAMELKMLHAPLTPSQQEKYDRRFMKSEPEMEPVSSDEKEELSIEIKAVDPTKAKTTEIIPNELRESLEAANTIEVPDVSAVRQDEQTVYTEQEETQPEKMAEKTQEMPVVEPDLDIQVKTVDVGEYNTINLQQELAQNLSRMFAQEDMEAADATMALPIETIIDTAASMEAAENDKVIDSISDDAIKDTLLAPLLQETTESGQIAEEGQLITEEDLLASMEQERVEAEKREAERIEAEKLEAEKREAERIEAEKLEAEKREAERLAAEKLEEEKREAERLAAEKLEEEKREAERQEAERLEEEKREAERIEAERLEAEKREAERIEAEKLEEEKREAERIEAEKLEAEKREAERIEAEKLEAEKREAERLAAEKLEEEKREAERIEAERLEAEKREAERLEAERLEAEKREAERLEAERIEAEKREAERQEAERVEAEKREAERLEAERIEAERREAERQEAERVEAEKREAERVAAERLEAERQEAARLAAERLEAEKQEAEQAKAPVTAGAIMAAEIAHAVTTGNTGRLNIGQAAMDLTKGSLDDSTDLQKKMLDEQISGQLNLLDIMNEWEETKKANEEKRIAQMREKVLKQTGPMFSNFDEIARASVSTNLDLINPAVDIFAKPQQEETAYKEEPVKEADAPSEDESVKTEQSIKETEQKSLNTEEINGLEEKLLEVLAKTEEEDKKEPIPTFVPDFNFEQPKEEVQIEEDSKKQRVIISEEAVTPVTNLLATMIAQEEKEETAKVVQTETTDEAHQPINELLGSLDSGERSNATSAFELNTTIENAANIPETSAVLENVLNIEDEKEPPAGKPHFGRAMTKEEKELFGNMAPSKDLQDRVVYALDLLSLHPASGNALVIGENGTNRSDFAKNMIKHLQSKNPNFSGAIAKISGELLATKDVSATLRSLENGALIVENAGGMEMDILGTLLFQLERAPLKGIFVVLEDTKEELDRLIHTYPQIEEVFDARITIEVLDNDGLVNFAKAYANSQEYSIDEMGVLAVYTRISDMQTNEHAVTVLEVKNMVDEAIAKSSKKNVKHFMDVIIGKRYDDDDMIILREKDFSIE